MTFDIFGIQKIYNTTNSSYRREWYSRFHIGPMRTKTFGPSGILDPDLIFRGTGIYTINGSGTTEPGVMIVSGECPRIYIRNSNLNNSMVLPETKTWENTETTVYVKSVNIGTTPILYAGIQISQRTDHFPDTDLCSTRGIGSKLNFDGRCHFEKECCHGLSNKQTVPVYPFGLNIKMPLNTWIGLKSICRSFENNTKCKTEMYMDMTEGYNGGSWIKINEFIDYEGWSSDYPSCCETHKGHVLKRNYSIYFRTDGIIDQRYKWCSVREIDPLI